MHRSAIYLLVLLATPLFSAAVDVTGAAPSAEGDHLALGIGYPDLRLRYKLFDRLGIEAKAAFAEGLQVYSGRLSWDFLRLGPLNALAGGEGGWAKFDGIDTISGTGAFGQAYAGLELHLTRRLSLQADAGPAWLWAWSESRERTDMAMVFNTALYFYLW